MSGRCVAGGAAFFDVVARASGTGMWRWGRTREDLKRGNVKSESERAHGCEARTEDEWQSTNGTNAR